MELGDELVTGDDRPVMGEPLVSVDNPCEVDAGFRVVDQLRIGALGDDYCERRRGNDIPVA